MKQFSSTVARIKNASGEYEPIPALRGATPYEIAVKNGFKGTEEEWYNLSFDDGWVTKYQELEAGKANKADVYEKTYINTKFKEDVLPLKETAEKYRSMWDALVGKPTDLYYSVLAISPNRQYLCRLVYAYRTDSKTSGFTIELCRTNDMSVVQSYTVEGNGAYMYPHVEMDDDFIALCYPKTSGVSYVSVEYAMSQYSYQFQFNSQVCQYHWNFFTYDDNGMTKVSVSGVTHSKNYSRLPVFYPILRDGVTGKTNFWLLTQEDDGYGTDLSTQYVRLYNIDKSTNVATKKREWNLGIDFNYASCQYKYYRDGDYVIVAYPGDSENSICVDRISTASTVKLCEITDTGFGWAVNIKASQVVTIGTYGIRVYNFDGSLSHESSSIRWSSMPAEESIDIIDGYLYMNDTVVNLTTLNMTSKIYASINPVNGGTHLQFTGSIPILDKPILSNAYISTITSPNSSTYSNGKSVSGPILGINLTKMQFGGWVNE